jgi:type II secretory pathway pseudopilin PulG
MKKGFTLIETIIYMTLVGMIVTGFVSYGLNVAKIRDKVNTVRELETNTKTIDDFLSKLAAESDNILSPAISNTSDRFSGNRGGVDFSIFASNGYLLYEDSLGIEKISNKAVHISQLNVQDMSSGETLKRTIKIQFTISPNNEDTQTPSRTHNLVISNRK